MADLIQLILDNAGFLVGILFVIFAVGASSRKARRKQSEEGETAPNKKFGDIMAEIEAEMEAERRAAETPDPYGNAEKPFRDPYVEPTPPKKKPWGQQQASVAAEKTTATRKEDIVAKPPLAPKKAAPVLFKTDDLAQAIVMAEILAPPVSLREQRN